VRWAQIDTPAQPRSKKARGISVPVGTLLIM
jgi:hypothetical protein